MGLLSLIRNGLRRFVGLESLSGAASPERWFVDWWNQGQETSSGETVTPQGALACAAVKAAVSVLAETVASLPLDVYERTSDDGRRLAIDHPCQRMLHDEFNPEMSSYTARETTQGHLGTWGNTYSEIQRTRRGDPIYLWPRSPQPGRTKPVRREDGSLVYECRDERGNREPDINPADMLHIPGFGFDGLVGYSPISLCREAVGGALASQRYASEMFRNSGAQEGFITAPNKMGEPAYKRLKAQIAEYAATGNRHKMMILDEGMNWANRSMNPEDLQMVLARRFSIEEIARIYRITPVLLQDLTHATLNNTTELGRQFIVYTMMPWLRRWEAEINRKLLKPPFFCRFNVNAFMAGDPVQRADYHQKMLFAGIESINEVRQLEDLNPIGELGDVHWIQSAMVPLEKAAEGPQEPKAPGFSERPLDEDKDDEKDKDDEQEPPKKEAGGEDGQKIARQWLDDTLDRMRDNEAQAARRAAKRPRFFTASVSAFYERFEETLVGAIRQPCSLLGELPEAIAEEHCTAAKTTLLSASECQPDELIDRVEAWIQQNLLNAGV